MYDCRCFRREFFKCNSGKQDSKIAILEKKTTEQPQIVLVGIGDMVDEAIRRRTEAQLLRDQMAFQLQLANRAKVLLIPLLFAVGFNMAAWLTNKAKTALAAGILYVISLNIISAVLCFVGYEEMKRNTAAKPEIVR
jgi:hypothetical protein